MKINNFSLDQAVAVTNSLQGKPSNPAPSGLADAAETAVQFMFDTQVKNILTQLTKMLSQQASTLMELPAPVADEVKQLLREPLVGEQVVAKGLTGMLQGQKSVSRNLASFAAILNDAAVIKEQFPTGLTKTWSGLIAQFEDQISQLDSDIGKSLLALATELTDNPTPFTDASAVLQQAGRALLDILPRDQYTIPKQEFLTKLPVLLQTLVYDFQEGLTKLPLPPLEQEMLTSSLRQVVQQLMQELAQPLPSAAAKGETPTFVSLPSIVDDIIAHFENQLIKLDATFEKDVLITNLRQILGQLTENLGDDDKAVLTRLADQLSERTPEKLLTAATLHNLPELREVWVLDRMAASRQWLQLPLDSLREAGQNLRDMNTVIPKHADMPPDASPARSSFNLAVPLYFGEEKRAYPAYIHIFQDRENASQTADGSTPETWLRLCLSTENVGVVDMVFHVYGQNQLNIRINFSDTATADRFKVHVDDIRGEFHDSPLHLADFTVNPVPSDGSS